MVSFLSCSFLEILMGEPFCSPARAWIDLCGWSEMFWGLAVEGAGNHMHYPSAADEDWTMLVLLPFTTCPHLKKVGSLGKCYSSALLHFDWQTTWPCLLATRFSYSASFQVFSSSLYQCCGFFLSVLSEPTAISQAVFTGYCLCKVNAAYTVEVCRISLLQVVPASLLWSLQLQKRTSLPFSISLCRNLFFISASKQKVPRLLYIH